MNRSTYYNHLNHVPSCRELENQDIRFKLLELYIKYHKRLGAIKLNRRLYVEYDICISLGRVYRLLKSMNLPKMSTIKPKFKYKSDVANLDYNDHLNQEFNVLSPNKVWVSDITYIKTSKGFNYLCIIIDLFSRKVISWKISTRMTYILLCDTLVDVYNLRLPNNKVMIHSNRGSQYISFEFRKLIDQYNVVQSFSKKSHPWDTAVAESFFKFIKHEELNRRNYQNIEELRKSIFNILMGFIFL